MFYAGVVRQSIKRFGWVIDANNDDHISVCFNPNDIPDHRVFKYFKSYDEIYGFIHGLESYDMFNIQRHVILDEDLIIPSINIKLSEQWLRGILNMNNYHQINELGARIIDIDVYNSGGNENAEGSQRTSQTQTGI